MFDRNKNLSKPKQVKTTSVKRVSDNAFVRANQIEKHATTSLGNKAKKFTSTLNDFVDQFGKASQYKTPRSFAEISKDMEVLWNQNPLLTVMFTFYLRMVTRVTQLWDGTKTEKSQRGQGLKHEGIFRMMWIAVNYPDTFWKNIALYISIGSWKDIFTMLQYDLESYGWEDKKLDWNKFYALISAGLENPNTSELMKKYLPSISSKATTNRAIARNMIGKWLSSQLFDHIENKSSRYRAYRKLKSEGTAHEWQQLISKGNIWKIDFDTIHGRALSQLVSSKFLKNHGLEQKYQEWIENKPVAKYTGYVYELFKIFGNSFRPVPVKDYQAKTIDAQFMELVKKAQSKGVLGFVPVIDTSGSMEGVAPGTGMSAYAVAKAMTLFCSYLLSGPFKDSFFEFSDQTVYREWKGETPTEKFKNFTNSFTRNTNFQSVAKKFCEIKRTGVPESEFPTGIICFSDGCFDRTQGYGSKPQDTNYVAFRENLSREFSKEFVDNFTIILWDIPNGYYGPPQTAFEADSKCPGIIHVAGYDPSIIALLSGEEKKIPKTSEDLFDAAMEAEVLMLIEL